MTCHLNLIVLQFERLINRKGLPKMKKIIVQAIKFMYFFSCFFVLLGNTAFAYIDPSAVTYIIQAVAGVLIAIGAAATVYRHKIMKFFRQQKRKKAKRDKQADKAQGARKQEDKE